VVLVAGVFVLPGFDVEVVVAGAVVVVEELAAAWW
jgi:hypothetical protein